jgi:hypothetical protein
MNSGDRYMEWATESATAANLAAVLNTKSQELPPVQTIGTQKVVGTKWIIQQVIPNGANYLIVMWRWNHAV